MDSSIRISPSVHYYGTPVMLLSTLMPDGRTTNITPISSGWALDETFVLGLGRGGQALENLERCPELVINLPHSGLVDRIERIAPTTGAVKIPESKREQYRHEENKWILGGFTPIDSSRVLPTRIAECPVQIEAEVCGLTPLDDSHDAVIVHAKVVETHVHEGLVIPGTSYVNTSKWEPLYYTFRHYFRQGRQVGKNFRADSRP